MEPNRVRPVKIRSSRCKNMSRSIRKYSCSGPTEQRTLDTSSFPNNLRMRTACLLIASIERRSGVFLSSASPVYEQNAVGIQSRVPIASSRRNAGEVQSQAVYPRASKVARSPPDGKEEASGSPLISSLPENSKTACASEAGLRKESCFSAVTPVIGWNQWV